jgi:hypothetical protein
LRCCDDVGGRQSARAQIADAGIAVRLAQFLIRTLHDQWMVQKCRRLGAPEQAGNSDLPAG